MFARLAVIPELKCSENVPLSQLTRFAIGGPARILADASSEAALIAALTCRGAIPYALIGGGSNLVADDRGFPGVVLRYTAKSIEIDGHRVRVAAGAVLQDLVDATIVAGLEGLHTMTGIPGWVGGAVYGNAGAYGHSIHEFVESVRFFDGSTVREIGNAACEFHYRESVFKRHKDWIVLETTLRLPPGDAAALRATAEGILKVRNEKYPPTMRCAGSIFKNLILAELPESVRAQVPERVIRAGQFQEVSRGNFPFADDTFGNLGAHAFGKLRQNQVFEDAAGARMAGGYFSLRTLRMPSAVARSAAAFPRGKPQGGFEHDPLLSVA